MDLFQNGNRNLKCYCCSTNTTSNRLNEIVSGTNPYMIFSNTIPEWTHPFWTWLYCNTTLHCLQQFPLTISITHNTVLSPNSFYRFSPYPNSFIIKFIKCYRMINGHNWLAHNCKILYSVSYQASRKSSLFIPGTQLFQISNHESTKMLTHLAPTFNQYKLLKTLILD